MPLGGGGGGGGGGVGGLDKEGSLLSILAEASGTIDVLHSDVSSEALAFWCSLPATRKLLGDFVWTMVIKFASVLYCSFAGARALCILL